MRVPQFIVPGLTDFLNRWTLAQESNDRDKLSRVTANHSVLLQSPGNKIYELKVDDAGVLTTTLVAG